MRASHIQADIGDIMELRLTGSRTLLQYHGMRRSVLKLPLLIWVGWKLISMD